MMEAWRRLLYQKAGNYSGPINMKDVNQDAINRSAPIKPGTSAEQLGPTYEFDGKIYDNRDDMINAMLLIHSKEEFPSQDRHTRDEIIRQLNSK